MYPASELHSIYCTMVHMSWIICAWLRCRLSDTTEFKQTVAVLQFLANPQNDSALFALLETNLPLRLGLGGKVVEALRKTQADVSQPEACWHLLQRMACSPRVSTRKKNALHQFLEWHNRVFRAVMFMKLPDALLFVWKESGIAAAADKATKKKETNVQPTGSAQPTPAASPAAPSKCTPAKSDSVAESSRKAPPAPPRRVQVPDAHEVLVTPTLESMHRHAQEYYDDWTPSELQVDHFRAFRFEQVGSTLRAQPCSGFLEPEDPSAASAEGSLLGPPKLVAIAAAALWSQPDMKRAGDLMKLSSSSQQLSDVLLSVNKLGYGANFPSPFACMHRR